MLKLQTQQRVEVEKLKQAYCSVMVSESKRILQNPTRACIERLIPVIPHITEVITTLLETFIENECIVDLHARIAQFYEEQADYTQAEKLLKQGCQIAQERLKTRNPYAAAAFNNLAVFYCSQGRYEEAEPVYKKALSIYNSPDSFLNGSTRLSGLAVPGSSHFIKVSFASDIDKMIPFTVESGFEA